MNRILVLTKRDIIAYASEYSDGALTYTHITTYLSNLYEHVKYVVEYGRSIGIPEEQLEQHDLSKLSFNELPQYAAWHVAGIRKNEYLVALNHHFHHNEHHWQHWLIPGKNESTALEMPDKYILEMVADWHGASKAYSGDWGIQEWLNNNYQKLLLHPTTALKLRSILNNMGYIV
jgi:hypothetical protein